MSLRTTCAAELWSKRRPERKLLLHLRRKIADRCSVTDINLGGGLTGGEVADAFRASQPAIPVIYASGYPPEGRRAVAGSIFFGKPYLPGDILHACERLVT